MIRFAAIFTTLVMFASCSKKDLPVFEHLRQQKACVVESMNADRQNSDEFYFVKTFDQRGVVTHIKTQLREVHTTSYVYDHDIFYSLNGATLKGVKKTYGWYNSDPEDQNSALYAEELVELRDSNNIEVLFDKQTRKPVEVRSGPGGESVLKLTYNHRGFLPK